MEIIDEKELAKRCNISLQTLQAYFNSEEAGHKDYYDVQDVINHFVSLNNC